MSVRDAMAAALSGGLIWEEVPEPPPERPRFWIGPCDNWQGELVIVQHTPTHDDDFNVYLHQGDKWLVAEAPRS
jgi:hypothetical protein